MINRKFKATLNHELICAGFEMEFDKSEGKLLIDGFKWAFDIENVDDWLEKEWIEEMFEPIHTKQDMLKFGELVNNKSSTVNDPEDVEELYDYAYSTKGTKKNKKFET